MRALNIMLEDEQYEKLQKDQAFLEALQSVGVDNWVGYCDAQDLMDEE